MSQSRNAKRAWDPDADGAAPAPFIGDAARVAAPGRARRDAAARHGGGLQPAGDAFRTACRMFPGFAELPAAFRATVDPYAQLFDPATGPLDLRERELIARAVTGRDAGAFGDAAGATTTRATAPELGDAADAGAGDAIAARIDDAAAARDRLIAEFAVKVTRRWLAIGGGDVERLLDAGVPARSIRAIAETAAVFHFLGELSAAMLLRPRVPPPGRASVAAVASRDPSWRELSRWLA
jgi:hypothetical protein